MRVKHWLIRTAGACYIIPLAAQAALPEQFTLGRFVPHDAFLFVNYASNPQRTWIAEKWREVFCALEKSGIDAELTALVQAMADDGAGPEFLARIERASALLRGVKWSDLFDREIAFAERLTTTLPGYEYVVLGMGKAETMDRNTAGLVEILKEIAALTGGSPVDYSSVGPVEVWSVKWHALGDQDFVLAVELFRRGEVFGLAIGSRMAADALALLTGVAPDRSILSEPRFNMALAMSSTPGDAVVYADVRLALAAAGGLLDNVAAREPAGRDPAIRKVRKALAMCDVLDFTVTTRRTEGRRVLSETITGIQQDKTGAVVARAFFDRKPFEPFDKYVPADAIQFSLVPLADLGALYGIVVDFIADEAPDGAQAVSDFRAILAAAGFDPQRDLFSWLSGETICVSMPSCTVTPMRCTDSVYLVRVKDTALAARKLSAALSYAREKLSAAGHGLVVSPAAVKAEGFVSISHPAVAMYVCPVVGVKDGWLITGTSAEAVNKCLDVAENRAPSIRANPRFQREGILPAGPVRSAYFKDRANVGAELSSIAGAVGTVGSMLVATIPDQPESLQAKKVLRALMNVMMKLRPILAMIDFYSSESAVATFDGTAVHQRRVLTYMACDARDAPRTVKVP